MWSIIWSENYVITDETRQDADPNANPPVLEIGVPTNARFEIVVL